MRTLARCRKILLVLNIITSEQRKIHLYNIYIIIIIFSAKNGFVLKSVSN